MKAMRWLLVMTLLLLGPVWAGAASSNHWFQVKHMQGGFERLSVGVPVTAALSSNPTVPVLGPDYTDDLGWAKLCVASANNYHVNLNGKVLANQFLNVAASGNCTDGTAPVATPTASKTSTPGITATPTLTASPAGPATLTPTPAATPNFSCPGGGEQKAIVMLHPSSGDDGYAYADSSTSYAAISAGEVWNGSPGFQFVHRVFAPGPPFDNWYVTNLILRFDLTGLPAGKTVTKAELGIRTHSGKNDGDNRNFDLTYYSAPTTLSETTWQKEESGTQAFSIDITALTLSTNQHWNLSNLGSITAAMGGKLSFKGWVSGSEPFGSNSVIFDTQTGNLPYVELCYVP